jgi:hypothetical protein
MNPPQRPAKIFCIGLNKTGTSSLHDALVTLGFSSLHWGGPSVAEDVRQAFHAGRLLVSDHDRYDAYSDIAGLSKRYELLDRQYPGSRFLLTTRPMEAWVESRRAHVLRNQERRAVGKYTGDFLEVQPDQWREEYIEHHEGVRAYFDGRSDYCEMRITEGDGWETLCPFLDVPVPSDPFPWHHRLATS